MHKLNKSQKQNVLAEGNNCLTEVVLLNTTFHLNIHNFSQYLLFFECYRYHGYKRIGDTPIKHNQ